MKNYLLLFLSTLISLSVYSQGIDSIVEIKPVRVSIDPPKILNFKQKHIEDSIALTKFSLKRTYKKFFGVDSKMEEKMELNNFSFNRKNIKSIDTTSFRDLYLGYTPTKTYNKKSPDTLKTLDYYPPAQLGDYTYVFNGQIFLFPPDVQIAAGNEHIVQMTNVGITIFDKSLNVLSELNAPDFFLPAGYDRTKYSIETDPRIKYDSQKNRWICTMNGGVWNEAHNPISILGICVSKTDDPTGEWYQYIIRTAGFLQDSTDLIDYDQVGYNKNWVVITDDVFDRNDMTGGTKGSSLFIFNKDSLYNGLLSQMNRINLSGNTNRTHICPTQTEDTTTNDLFFVSDATYSPMYIKIDKISGSINNPTFIGYVKLLTSPNGEFDSPLANAPQKNYSQDLAVGVSTQYIQNAILINGYIWLTTTATLLNEIPLQDRVLVWMIDANTLKVKQFFKIENDTAGVHYFYPQLAVNKNNDAIVVFGKSSVQYDPSLCYSYRSASDSLNTFREPVTYKWGVSAQNMGLITSDYNRWGDYFGACTDPVDSSFWVSGETFDSTLSVVPYKTWLTPIAHVDRVDPCSKPINLTSTKLTNTSVYLSWSSSFSDTSYLVSYRQIGTGTWYSDTVSTTYDTITNLLTYRDYECTVQSFCSEGLSLSSSITFKPVSPVCVDYYEFNDVRTTGKNINTNTDIFATIGKRNDKDFYKFKTTKPNTNINIVLSELTQDYDIILYNSNGSILTSSYNSGTNNESITYNSNVKGNYYVLVKSKTSTVFDSANCYKLRVNTN